MPGLDPIREPRAHRIGEHDANAGKRRLQPPPDAGDGSAGAGAGDERADAAVGLLEDLRTRRLLVDADVRGVPELVGEEPAVLLGHPLRDVAEVVGARRRRVRRDDDLARRATASATRLSTDIFSGITQTSP